MIYDCLIVDDEIELAKATCEYFEMFEVKTVVAANAAECMEIMKTNQIKLILLDINLGSESGFTLCKELREKTNIPILFISARQSDDDVLIALNIGGDDYIKKPYSLSVLLAKVKVILKRYESLSIVHNLEMKHDSGICVDKEAMKVLVNGKDVLLKTKEFKLFCYLYENKNKVVTKDELFRNVWGDLFFSDGTLNVHIRKIREKVEENPNEPRYIKTVWGTGYIYED
jgi:Response regulators consisting of a CheY-like receiver domain and a winged-helix DNA-binding domain